MMSIHGYCDYCKDSIYPNDEYVCSGLGLYHIECAEAAEIDEEAAKRQEGE